MCKTAKALAQKMSDIRGGNVKIKDVFLLIELAYNDGATRGMQDVSKIHSNFIDRILEKGRTS